MEQCQKLRAALNPAVNGGGELSYTEAARIWFRLIGLKDTIDLDLTKKLEVKTFLNRLLGLPVSIQCCLFDYFVAIHDKVIDMAKKSGEFDGGITQMNASKVYAVTQLTH